MGHLKENCCNGQSSSKKKKKNCCSGQSLNSDCDSSCTLLSLKLCIASKLVYNRNIIMLMQ
jgi:hypothetical protein